MHASGKMVHIPELVRSREMELASKGQSADRSREDRVSKGMSGWRRIQGLVEVGRKE